MTYILEFNDLMTRGGPVMWVIFATAWLALVMLSERAIQLHIWLKQALRDQKTMELDAGYVPMVQGIGKTSPAAILLKRLPRQKTNDREELSQQISIVWKEMVSKLQGGLPTIAVLATLLPMLGLLGTVVGMIDVFEVVALHGTGDPQQMAHGISQALLTTASGLVVAIPVTFLHHLLVKRLQYLLSITEQSIMTVLHRDCTISVAEEIYV